ncbi:disease resistance-like protein DSC1 isoform X2 [Vitis riparia]|uniref:disease resistance-like protein DSC1 isoform X2 n=1 Tax=Vitis riparia TaxID=96939 RepID=UPI00155A0704|nr:disease resistance-like protein DSC1 isoform X2 [Vitis riparia]
MASTSTKTSSSSSNLPHKYDVFLSFRGEDTRTNFVDHLYAGLVANGFHTFRDDEQLERGGEIASQLLDAIEESRVFIVVFSENYADSRWCLNELLAIIDTMARDVSKIVLPIFYHVNPSDVRHQRGSYATRHTSPVEDADDDEVAMIEDWKYALTEVANFSGYPVDPNTDKGMRSRLWDHMDVQDVLKKRTGTKSIEGIFLNLSKLNNINLTTKAMKKMANLRLLKIFLGSEVVSGEEDYKAYISSDFEFPSWDLCYLHWHGYPLNSLPSNFEAEKLVELNMPYSNITNFGEGNMVQFSKLTAVILSHSKNLIKVSNFSSTPNLEKLILEGCTSLREIDPSIGDLERLGLLDLKECKSLGSLPDSICNLKSLKTLYLSGCSELNCLPEDLGNMQHLTELYANRTATGAPPPVIGRLRELQILSFSGCTGGRAYPSLFSLSGLSLLRALDLSDCYWWDARIPSDFWCLYSLEKLNLSGNHFTMVPTSITELSRLKVLVLGRCQRLQEIQQLPPSLEELDAHECVSLLTSLASSSDVVEATSRMMSLHRTILERIQDHAPKSEFCILIPGDGIPEWFEHREMGSSLTMELPSDWYDRDKFLGFCVCFVFAFKDQLPQIHHDILCQLNNFSFFYPYWDKWSGEHSSNDPHMWLAYQPRSGVDICYPEAWNSIRASFELSGVTDALSIKCGLHLIYK